MVRQLANDGYQTFSSAVPEAGTALSRAKPQDVPNQQIVVDAWVKDGVLSEVSIDLGQFAKKGDAASGHRLPIALAFSQDGVDISKPNATPVDLTQLGGLMGALGGGVSG